MKCRSCNINTSSICVGTSSASFASAGQQLRRFCMSVIPDTAAVGGVHGKQQQWASKPDHGAGMRAESASSEALLLCWHDMPCWAFERCLQLFTLFFYVRLLLALLLNVVFAPQLPLMYPYVSCWLLLSPSLRNLLATILHICHD